MVCVLLCIMSCVVCRLVCMLVMVKRIDCFFVRGFLKVMCLCMYWMVLLSVVCVLLSE